VKAGITGHRNFDDVKVINWVELSIKKIISKYNVSYGYSSLALGTDQIFCEILRNEKINYTAIIPCENYERTFDKTTINKYFYLKNCANEVIKLNFQKPSEFAFEKAGKYIVDISDILIAVWDGKKAKGLGGTGDIVNYAIKEHKTIIHINIINYSIHKLNKF